MLELFLAKAQEQNKTIETHLESISMENSTYPNSTFIIYEIEGSEPISKIIFQNGESLNVK
jgi:hypothetical protein